MTIRSISSEPPLARPYHWGYATTSSSSNAIGYGLKTFTIPSRRYGFAQGDRLKAFSTGSDMWMEGHVSSYHDTTLVVDVGLFRGSGTHSDWVINLAGEVGVVSNYSGSVSNAKIVETHATDIATFSVKTITSGLDASESQPIRLFFPDGSARTVTSALSVTLAAEQMLGVLATVPFRLWFVLIDDGGTIKLGVIQTYESATKSIRVFPPNGLLKVADFGNGAAAGLVYVDATPTVDVSYLVLGFAEYDSGLPGAGWTVSPSRIGLYGPGIKLPGQTVQMVGYQTGTYATGTSDPAMGLDNTAPQNNEGSEYMSHAVVANSQMSLFDVRAVAQLTPIDTGVATIAAIFLSGGTGGLDALVTAMHASNSVIYAPLYLGTQVHGTQMTTGTFSLRASRHTSGGTNMQFNGWGGEHFGGKTGSYMRIVERMT